MNVFKTLRKAIPFVLTGLVLAGCASGGTKDMGYKQIDQATAMNLMNSETGYIILDVRRPDEFSESHIVGAINIPNEEIGTDEIPELPDRDQLILVYCRSGNRSKQASEKLVNLGYTNILEFGGINTWTGETVSGNN